MPSFSLQLKGGSDDNKIFPFQSEEVRIGRNSSNSDFVLNDQSVSGQHAVISWTGKKYQIKDNESTNGTLLNGKKIKPLSAIDLQDGDELIFGRMKVVFKGNTVKKKLKPLAPIKDILNQTSPTVKNKKPLPKSRLLIYGLIFLILVVIGSSFIPTKKKPSATSGTTKTKSISKTTHALPAKGPFSNKTMKNKQELSFSFYGRKGQSKLLLNATKIDREEIVVFLNGNNLGFLPETFGDIEEMSIDLPSEAIRVGEQNFISLKIVKNNADWYFKDAKLKKIEGSDCNLTLANKFLNLGKEMYVEKSVNRQNLYLSVLNYEKAISLSASCTPLPSWYPEAISGHKKSETELNNEFQNILFHSRKFVKVGKKAQAVSLLESVFSIIPDSKDERVVEATQLIQKINVKKKKK